MSAIKPRAAATAVLKAFRETPHASRLLRIGGRGAHIYLAGGFVRDAILGRQGPPDLDFTVTGDAREISESWARTTGAKVVPLDPDRGIWRVAGKVAHRIWTWDFTALRGKDIIEDLGLRDFTVNALGLSLRSTSAILDPTGGLGDLERKTIRHTNPKAFDDDPLRRLRAYRFAAQLGFSIHASTRRLLPGGDLPASVSGERIRDELAALLLSGRSARLMERIVADRMLSSLWPGGKPDVQRLALFERLADRTGPGALPKPLADFLVSPSTHGIPHRTLLKLVCLTHPAGRTGASQASSAGRSLRFMERKLGLGRRASRFMIFSLDALWDLDSQPGLLTTPEGPWIFLDRFGTAGLGAMTLFAASRPDGGGKADLHFLTDFYHRRYLPDRKKKKLLVASEVSRVTGISPGPSLGDLIYRLEMARRTGRIGTRKEAEALLRKLTARSESD